VTNHDELQSLRNEVDGLTGLVSALINAMVIVLQTHPDRATLIRAWDAADGAAFAPNCLSPIAKETSKSLTVAYGDMLKEEAPQWRAKRG
jgi:hypothetical protein